MPVLRKHCIPGKAWMAFWNTISAAFPSKNSVVTGTSSFYVRCKKRCVFLNVVNTIYTVWMNSSVNKLIRIYKARVVPNPFIPQSDQLQISPAALLENLHHTVWKGCDKNPCLIAWGKWVLVWGKQVLWPLARRASKVDPEIIKWTHLVTSHYDILSLSEDDCLLLFTVREKQHTEERNSGKLRINFGQWPKPQLDIYYLSRPDEEMAFNSLLRWKMIDATNSHYLTYTFLFRRMYFLNLEVKGLKRRCMYGHVAVCLLYDSTIEKVRTWAKLFGS